MFKKINEREARWIYDLASIGASKREIADRYGYKYMDVVNVLRGNSYSHVTGILNRNINAVEQIVSMFLLKQGKPYRDIAAYTNIDANKIRNVMGVLQYKGVIS